MSTPTQASPSRYRFGPFEVDPAARELRRDSERVRVQELPLRILLFLLARPGQVVSREELQQHLWPAGTFVEFEHGLNTAIKKLRQALGDDADKPQFIETVPRQGYRFVGVIESVEPSQLDRKPIVSRRTMWAIVAACLVIAVSVGLWIFVKPTSEPARNEALLVDLKRMTSDSGLSAEPAISPDGELVAYASDRGANDNLDLWVMHARGGEPIRLTDHPADDREPHFCPDGRVVFRSERDGGGVYIVPALGGNPLLLVRDGRGPQCSSDGKHVAFWTGEERTFEGNGVFSVPTTGGAPTRLALDLRNAFRPLWSPDNKFLLVYGHEEGRRSYFEADWWLTPVEGGKSAPLHVRERLASSLDVGSGLPPFVTWDARTSEVFFSAAERTVDPFALWQANLWSIQVSAESKSLGKLRQLTGGSGQHREASAASNGAVAFSDLEIDPDIFSVLVDHSSGKVSGPIQPVMTDRHWQSRPVISRGGEYMVFRTEREKGWDFWLKDLKSGRERPVTVSGGAKVWAVINREGSQIAYHTAESVYVADTKTGASRTLCKGCKFRVADWAPSGDAILVYDEDANALELLNLSTGGRKEVLRGSQDVGLMCARISPDGRWLAYCQGGDLRVVAFDGRTAVRGSGEWKLSGVKAREWIDWSPDGGLIYFLSPHEGSMCLWSVRPRTDAVAVPVLHFHQKSQALLGGFSVGPDRLYLGLHETTGNIWTGKLRN